MTQMSSYTSATINIVKSLNDLRIPHLNLTNQPLLQSRHCERI